MSHYLSQIAALWFQLTQRLSASTSGQVMVLPVTASNIDDEVSREPDAPPKVNSNKWTKKRSQRKKGKKRK